MAFGSYLQRGLLLISGLIACVAIAGLLFIRNEDTMTTAVGPSWRNIIPGRTSQQELLAIMGQPVEIFRCEIPSDGSMVERILDVLACFSAPLTYRYRESPISDAPTVTHEIWLRSDKVSVIKEDVRLQTESQPQELLRKHVEKFGWPNQVVYSKRSHYASAVLFCDRGTILVAGENSAEWIYYFVPMSLERCLTTFKNEISVDNPYQGMDVILGPPNKWPWLKTEQ